ncbi:hypothetical protein BC828DRAFT_407018 [Blastocladiella britannica]|nr:hypothetical protein BC828DRAFT_407018 [Blastocladiella britannica]
MARFSSPLLAVLVLVLVANAAPQMSTGTGTSAAPAKPVATPVTGATSPTTGTTGTTAGAASAGSAGAAGALSGMTPAMMQCTAAVMPLASDACFAPMLNDVATIVSAQKPDDMYNGVSAMVNDLCSATCATSFRTTTQGLMGVCSPALISMVAANVTLPQNAQAALGSVGTSLVWFAKDLVCVKDGSNNNQRCADQSIALAKKYQLIMSVATMAPVANTSPTKPATAPSMGGSTMAAGDSAMHMVMPTFDLTKFKTIPKAEACTPCTAIQISQSASFVKQKLQAVISLGNATLATQIGKETDDYITGVNGYCGDNFVSSTGALVFGTDNPTTVIAAKTTAAAPVAAGAGHSAASLVSAALAVVAAVFVTIA